MTPSGDMPIPALEAKPPFLEVEQVGRWRWKARAAREERWLMDGKPAGDWSVEHYGPKRPNNAGAGIMRPGGWPYWYTAWTRERALRKARRWLERRQREHKLESERERVEA